MGITFAKAEARGMEIAARYDQGLSIAQLAEEFGMSESGIYKRLTLLGVSMRRQGRSRGFPTVETVKRLLNGDTAADIARDLGLADRSVVWKRLHHRGVHAPDLERYRPLLDMVPEGLKELHEAMEHDGLSFEDAFDIAIEYQPQRRAA